MCASAAGRLGFLMVCSSSGVRRPPRRDVHGLCQHVAPAWEEGAGGHMGSWPAAVHSTQIHPFLLSLAPPGAPCRMRTPASCASIGTLRPLLTSLGWA